MLLSLRTRALAAVVSAFVLTAVPVSAATAKTKTKTEKSTTKGTGRKAH